LVSHFSDFSVIFYAIYKNQPLTFTIGVALLQERPWEDFYFCNVVPGAREAVLFAGIRRARRRSRPGKDGEGRGVAKGSTEFGELAGARGRGRTGKVEGWLRVRFAGLDGVEWLRRWGALAASGGGRRGLYCDAAGACRSWAGGAARKEGVCTRMSEEAGFYTQALAPDSSERTAGSCEERTAAQCPRQPRRARGMGKGFTA
jgi:hypothetical protein